MNSVYKLAEVLFQNAEYFLAQWQDEDCSRFFASDAAILREIGSSFSDEKKPEARVFRFLTHEYKMAEKHFLEKNMKAFVQVYSRNVLPLLAYFIEVLKGTAFNSAQLLTIANETSAAHDFEKAERALLFLRAAYSEKPDTLYMSAYVALQLEQYQQAAEFAQKALETGSKMDAECYMLLGFAQRGLLLCREAIAALEKSNEIVLKSVNLKQNAFVARNFLTLGQLYNYVGDNRESMNAYLSASMYGASEKQRRDAYSSYLLCLHYSDLMSDEELFSAHCRYRNFFSECKVLSLRQKQRKKSKIRVGYLSPDFRKHVMYSFYQAFLRNYDKNNFEVYVYCLNEADEKTARMKQFPDKWVNLYGMTAIESAAVIQGDEIDILFDLAGHSADSGLPIMKYRPALVQISGLGYFDTTGLDEIDYFLTDRFVDPPNMHDSLFTESLLRLPYSHFCYFPPEDILEPVAAPCLKNGYVTFCCFNKYAKITDAALNVWSKILQALPESRLILKSIVFVDERICQEAQERFHELSIDLERVEFRPATRTYMEEFLEADIMLDTFPYPGGGMTCDALYMGIPVITMEGRRHGARFGYSILCNIGLEELAVKTESEYIARAIGLASDKELLNLLHLNLRQMMQKSPLMDSARYMNEIEKLYRKIKQ